MSQLFIQDSTKKQVEKMMQNPTHAILLHGRFGVGLKTLALDIAKKITSSSNVMVIQPDEKGSIKIEFIRQLYKYTRTKMQKKLVIIIDDADAMLQPAQNALLKLLEEPPAHVRFILTSHSPEVLLPTIRSRTQEISISPISKEQSKQLLESLNITDSKKSVQIHFIAEGLPAEITRLASDDEYFEKRSLSIRMARDFLQGTTYKKLVISYGIGNDRKQALALLSDIGRITEMSIKQKPNRKLAELLDKTIFIQEKLRADGNIRTQLLRLAVG